MRDFLPDDSTVLRLIDVRDLGDARPGEELVTADLTSSTEMRAVMEGVDAVIHPGGIAGEDTYGHIRDVNVDGTYDVLKAARQAGTRRVAFASSIHAVGLYPRTDLIGPEVPVRPDTSHGVSKVYGEALGRMYAEKYGVTFVSVRICSFRPRPRDTRHLSTWLSPRDAAQLFARAVTAPPEVLPHGFRSVAGISGNARRWMTPESWDALGYVPQDDAESHAAEVESLRGDPDDLTEQRQGGVFVSPNYRGRTG
ncbi:NAD(P)-dependent oxidoreductase [Deinococcus sp. YIM 134068]|uniref:NAD-dependent epimerase/dehydratase family protein n=1 Tax=Deinococcus lichenicola TaxID=3118910 RepID=UPI002F929281